MQCSRDIRKFDHDVGEFDRDVTELSLRLPKLRAIVQSLGKYVGQQSEALVHFPYKNIPPSALRSHQRRRDWQDCPIALASNKNPEESFAIFC